MSGVYYNEWDGYCAQWLRNLIAAGHLPEGEVDERDIKRVGPDDLRGFSQCHFFAGIGGWPLALRLARWPDAQSIWTGSCPCQPFSCAGKRTGESDERHLWPEFHRLISARRPATVAGEQVASKDGREWFAGVRVDLEALGYGVGAADLCAAGAGAPHIRQRLWWVAAHVSPRLEERSGEPEDTGPECETIERDSAACRLADSTDPRRPGERKHQCGSSSLPARLTEHGRVRDGSGWMENPERHSGYPRRPAEQSAESNGADGARTHTESGRSSHPGRLVQSPVEQMGPAGLARESRDTAWSTYDLIPCFDGKARRIESGSFPLAHGIPARVGKLRAYGNAIVPQVAASFIAAYMECRP